jgi:hypothetical protein
VVGDGGGSSKSFDPTDGVEVSGFGLSSVDDGDAFVEGLPPTVGGFVVSTVSVSRVSRPPSQPFISQG